MTFTFLAVIVHRRNTDRAERVSPHSQPGEGETRLLHSPRDRGSIVPSQAVARALESEMVGRLARFFPEASPVRIPIKLSRLPGNGNGERLAGESDCVLFQETVIEYGTPREVLFAIDHRLEFGDHVLVESRDRSLHAEASVVAVQYHPERTVVAVRFLKPVPNWIVKS